MTDYDNNTTLLLVPRQRCLLCRPSRRRAIVKCKDNSFCVNSLLPVISYVICNDDGVCMMGDVPLALQACGMLRATWRRAVSTGTCLLIHLERM